MDLLFKASNTQKQHVTTRLVKQLFSETVDLELETAPPNAMMLDADDDERDILGDLDVDALVVAEAWVGKSITMKRFMARGRGRASRIEKPFSNLTIVVREVEEQGEAA